MARWDFLQLSSRRHIRSVSGRHIRYGSIRHHTRYGSEVSMSSDMGRGHHNRYESSRRRTRYGTEDSVLEIGGGNTLDRSDLQ